MCLRFTSVSYGFLSFVHGMYEIEVAFLNKVFFYLPDSLNIENQIG